MRHADADIATARRDRALSLIRDYHRALEVDRLTLQAVIRALAGNYANGDAQKFRDIIADIVKKEIENVLSC